MIQINKYGYVVFLLPLLLILACCKKSRVTFKNDVKSTMAKIENQKLTGNIIIFIHGTHTATMNRIFKPFISVPNRIVNIDSLNNMHYMRNIAQALSKAAPDFSWHNFYVYGWSGILDPKEREDAAKTLYSEIKKLILECKKQHVEPKITIVTHSHGGNVALNLAKFKDDNSFCIDRLILLAVPVQEMTSEFVSDALFRKIYSFSSSLDLLQIGDPQALYKASNTKKNCPFFSKRFFAPRHNLRQAKIKINDRAIFHIEFIMERFIKFIPALIKQLDFLNESLYLIKLSSGRDLKVIRLTRAC